MKISDAFRKAFRIYFGRFSETMGFLAVEICLRLFCLAPLLFLCEARLKYLALLCIPLVLFCFLPGRISAAFAMRKALDGGALLSPLLTSAKGYGGKLACALQRVLLILAWSVPLTVCAVLVKINYSGDTDAFTVMRSIQRFGGGDLMTGAKRILVIVLAALLLTVIGCAFHSGARHAYAQGRSSLVKGYHGKILLCWLASLVSILPLLIAFMMVFFRYLPALGDLTGLLMKQVKLPPLKGTLMILGVGAVLSLPLLPLRPLVTAAYVDGLSEKQ